MAVSDFTFSSRTTGLILMLCGTLVLQWLGSSAPRAEMPADTRVLHISAPDLPGASMTGGRGVDAEIVALILTSCGYQVDFAVQPFIRHIKSFEKHSTFDAVMTVAENEIVPGYASTPYIVYQNGVFYLEDQVAPIHAAEDLRSLDLVTFKNGAEILRLNGVTDVKSLLEVSDQRRHLRMLERHRVDAVLADKLIFTAINTMSQGQEKIHSGTPPTLAFSPIFPPSPYKMVFRDKQVQADFEQCKSQALASGQLDNIIDKYQQLYHQHLPMLPRGI